VHGTRILFSKWIRLSKTSVGLKCNALMREKSGLNTKRVFSFDPPLPIATEGPGSFSLILAQTYLHPQSVPLKWRKI